MKLNIMLFSSKMEYGSGVVSSFGNGHFASTSYVGNMDYSNGVLGSFAQGTSHYSSRSNDKVKPKKVKKVNDLLKKYMEEAHSMYGGEIRTVSSADASNEIGWSKSTSTSNSSWTPSQKTSAGGAFAKQAPVLKNNKKGKINNFASEGTRIVGGVGIVDEGGKEVKNKGKNQLIDGYVEAIGYPDGSAVLHGAGASGVLGGFATSSYNNISNSKGKSANGIDFDKIDFDLDRVNSVVGELKEAVRIIEGNIEIMTDYSVLDLDTNREKNNKKSKKKSEIEYQDNLRTATINKLKGSGGEVGLLGEITNDYNRAVNVRNAILEANGIAAELYDDENIGFGGSIGSEEYLSTLDGSYGEFLSQPEIQYIPSEDSDMVAEGYVVVNNRNGSKATIGKVADNYEGAETTQKSEFKRSEGGHSTSVSGDKDEVGVLSYTLDTSKEKIAKTKEEYEAGVAALQGEFEKKKAEVEANNKALLDQIEKERSAQLDKLGQLQSEYEEKRNNIIADYGHATGNIPPITSGIIDENGVAIGRVQGGGISGSVGNIQGQYDANSGQSYNEIQNQIGQLKNQYEQEALRLQNEYKNQLSNIQADYQTQLGNIQGEIQANNNMINSQISDAISEYNRQINNYNIETQNYINQIIK